VHVPGSPAINNQFDFLLLQNTEQEKGYTSGEPCGEHRYLALYSGQLCISTLSKTAECLNLLFYPKAPQIFPVQYPLPYHHRKSWPWLARTDFPNSVHKAPERLPLYLSERKTTKVYLQGICTL